MRGGECEPESWWLEPEYEESPPVKLRTSSLDGEGPERLRLHRFFDDGSFEVDGRRMEIVHDDLPLVSPDLEGMPVRYSDDPERLE